MKRLLEVMTKNYQVMKCIFTPLHPFLANLQKNLIKSAHSPFPFSHTPSLCQYGSDVYSTKRAVVCNRNSFNFDGLFGLRACFNIYSFHKPIALESVFCLLLLTHILSIIMENLTRMEIYCQSVFILCARLNMVFRILASISTHKWTHMVK